MFETGIAVIGLGYIGLPTSAAIAMRACGSRESTSTRPRWRPSTPAEAPIVEPDLDVAVAGAHGPGALVRLGTASPQADAFLIAVPTPFPRRPRAGLSYVGARRGSHRPELRGGEVVILESTSPPGTTRKVSAWIAGHGPTCASLDPRRAGRLRCPLPERVLPGRIMVELVANDRVIGGLTPECAEPRRRGLRSFCQGEIVSTTPRAPRWRSSSRTLPRRQHRIR